MGRQLFNYKKQKYEHWGGETPKTPEEYIPQDEAIQSLFKLYLRTMRPLDALKRLWKLLLGEREENG